MADTRTFYAHEGYEVEAIEVYKLALIVRLRNAAKQLQAWPVSFPLEVPQRVSLATSRKCAFGRPLSGKIGAQAGMPGRDPKRT